MPDARRHWRRERGPSGVVGPPEGRGHTGCAANVQKAVGSALSMCGELRGDSRSDEARGSNGVWRVTGEGGTSRQSEVKESP
eukprot:scaffold44883_cov38-Phaeocystis_antarctica.AAC.2